MSFKSMLEILQEREDVKATDSVAEVRQLVMIIRSQWKLSKNTPKGR